MEQAIYDILKNTAAVTAIVGTGDDCRIYPVMIPQGIKKPAITYQRISDLPTKDKDGVSKLDVDLLDLDFWGFDYDVLKNLKKEVRTALDGFDGTKKGHTLNIIYDTSSPELFDGESKKFHLVDTYSIREKR